MHADWSEIGYFDWFADLHCLTLDNRRYADRPSSEPDANISRLGAEQFGWMETILNGSDAEIFLLFSAGIFASRRGTNDCYLFGWRREYDRAMSLFHDVQLGGKRVVIVSGDAHGLESIIIQIPLSGRKQPASPSWSSSARGSRRERGRPPSRAIRPSMQLAHVMGTSGLGLVVSIRPAFPTGQ